MEIKIKETGELEELVIIDPKTGCNWAGDLLGNHAAEMTYDSDAGCYIMDQETFAWWDDLIMRYQAADDHLHEVRSRVDNPEDLDAYLFDMSVGACDLDDYPDALTEAVNGWLSEQE